MAGLARPVRSAPAAPRPTWARPLGLWNVIVLAAWVVGPFAAAGTLRWQAGWLHLISLAAGFAAHQAWVVRHDPALVAARRHPGPGTKGWDVAWNALFWPLLASVALVAGLEFRVGCAALAPVAWGAGLLLLTAGLALSAWAMAVNPWFEGTVRIQRERHQRVVETGPYRRVRHPGYAGLALVALASPLLLRSAAAYAPAAAVVAWLVLRTALEDGVLRRELVGYLAYCGRTRWRLVPGVW